MLPLFLVISSEQKFVIF